MKPLQITFHLDGSGIFYDPSEPPMLDGILAAALIRWHHHGDPPARDERPFDCPLPLKVWREGNIWGHHASALFPDGATAESTIHWRKRLRQNRIELTKGSPNTTNGTYRDWNMPIPLLLCRRLVAWAVGDRRKILTTLRRDVKYIGKKRGHGRGMIVHIDVDPIDEDFSIRKDGESTRYYPDPDGTRPVRTRPPYWNLVDQAMCCEITYRHNE